MLEGLLPSLAWVALAFGHLSGGSWTNFYSGGSNYNTSLSFDIAEKSSHRWIGVGSQDPSFIAEFDQEGKVAWQQNFDDFDFHHIVKDDEKFYAVGNSQHRFDLGTMQGPGIVKFEVKNGNVDLIWVRQPAIGFYTQVHDATLVSDDGLMVVGDVYGAFTNNASFTLQPRGFILRYDKYGAHFWAVALSTSSYRWDAFHSLLYESDGNSLSIVGWSAYDMGKALFPVLSLITLSDDIENPLFNRTTIFLILNQNNISTTQGIVGYDHIATEDGGYAITGAILTPDNITNVTAYHLFVGKVDHHHQPLWFRIVEGVNSAGLTIVVRNGRYIVGGHWVDKGNPSLLMMSIKPSQGRLVAARTLKEVDYNITLGFNLKVASNSYFYMTGSLASNDSFHAVKKLLLHKANLFSNDCSEKVALNFTLLDGIATLNLSIDDLEQPDLYTFDNLAGIKMTNRHKITKNNRCYRSDDIESNKRRKRHITIVVTVVVIYLSLNICYICRPLSWGCHHPC